MAAAGELPCDSHPRAPVGGEASAVTVALLGGGAPRAFDFPPRTHEALAEGLGLVDLRAGASIAGHGWALLTGDGVLLEAALVAWALARLAARGFTLVAPPDVAHARLVAGCGFNPRPVGGGAGGGGGGSEGGSGGGSAEPAAPALVAGAGPGEAAPVVGGAETSTSAVAVAGGSSSGGVPTSQVYTLEGSNLCLIGTAEIALAGLHEGAILRAEALPALYAGVSHCFRREAEK